MCDNHHHHHHHLDHKIHHLTQPWQRPWPPSHHGHHISKAASRPLDFLDPSVCQHHHAAHDDSNCYSASNADVCGGLTCHSTTCECLHALKVALNKCLENSYDGKPLEEHFENLANLTYHALDPEDKSTQNLVSKPHNVRSPSQTQAQLRLSEALISLIRHRPSTQLCRKLSENELFQNLLRNIVTEQQVTSNYWTSALRAWQDSMTQVACLPQKNLPVLYNAEPNAAAAAACNNGHGFPVNRDNTEIHKWSYDRPTLPLSNFGQPPTYYYAPNPLIRHGGPANIDLTMPGMLPSLPPVLKGAKGSRAVRRFRGIWL